MTLQKLLDKIKRLKKEKLTGDCVRTLEIEKELKGIKETVEAVDNDKYLMHYYANNNSIWQQIKEELK